MSRLQGVGLGFVFIPLNLVAFATLDPKQSIDVKWERKKEK